MLTVKDFVKAFSKRNTDWGVDGYSVPTRDNFYKTQKVLKWQKKENNNSYIEQIIKKAKLIPDPQKYGKVEDWRKNASTGKFTKNKKMTYVDEIFKGGKKPGPGSYNNVVKFRILGTSKT